MSQSTTPRNTGTGRPMLMNRFDRLGLGVLLLIFLGGLWLMAAPFIVGYQPRSGHWSHGTINIFAVGAGMSVLALATMIIFVGGMLYELTRAASPQADVSEQP